MFESRKIDFENELNRRSYVYNGLESYSVRFVYARNYGAFIINVIIEKLNSGVYEVYCTVKVATSDQVAFRFNIHDRGEFIPELVNNIEEKAKIYRAIVKFVES
jgi:tRNA uridine 5-carbamoylmethylation protein Kti12